MPWRSCSLLSMKMPLRYFLVHNSVLKTEMKRILENLIKQLVGMGYKPRALICDQASANRTLLEYMGATEDKPKIVLAGHELFTICDAPHLVKSTRNNLLTCDFEIDGKLMVSFHDIKQLYEIKKKHNVRTAHKLIAVHLNINTFKKISVRLAAQVLSATVTSVLETAQDIGILKTAIVRSTANFLRATNDLFDSLNRRHIFETNEKKKEKKKKHLNRRRPFGNFSSELC